MRKSFSLFSVCMLCSICIAFAQNIVITGTVNDEDNEPMYGVNVFVPGTTIGTTTDFDGKYRLSVPPTTDVIQVKYLGYNEMTYTLDKSKMNQTFNAQMQRAEIGLQQVVVSASKRKERILDAPASVSVLGTEQIEKSVALTPIDHLKKTPGVDIMTTGLVSSNVNIRGFNNIFSGAMLTMVDNRIGRVPSLRVNAFQLIPSTSDDIEKIEVVRGPGSALYGPNASDGVMHIITKSPLDQDEKFKTTVSFAGGSRSVIKPEIRHSGKLSEKFGYKISGSYMQGNDWEYYDPREPSVGDALIFGTVQNGEVFAPDTAQTFDFDGNGTIDSVAFVTGVFDRDFEIQKFNADARLDFKVNDDIDITLTGGVARTSNIELTGLGGAQGVNWVYSYGQVRARWKDLFFNYFINSSNAGDTYLIPQVGDADPPHNIQRLVDKSKLHGLQLQHSYDDVKNLNLIYGLDGLFTRPNTEGTINGRFEDDDGIDQIGGYVQAEYSPIEKITLVGAARVDYQAPIDEVQVSPRAAFVYKPTPRHTARLTYNRAFSTPSSLNLFLDISNGTHPVHGFNIRGIGNPNGYNYIVGDDGVPQYINLWTYDLNDPASAQYLSVSDRSNNVAHFENLLGVLQVLLEQAGISSLIAQSLINTAFSGIRGPGGTIEDVNLGGLDFIELLETGDPIGSQWNGDGDISGLSDLPVVESSITQTIEAGYKGIIEDKLFVTVDAYYTRISNFSSPLTLASPSIVFDPDEFAVAMLPVIDNLGPGVPGLSGQDLYNNMMALNAQVPSGIVTPDDPLVNTDMILTYINLGTVDVLGADLGASYLISDNISASGSFSYVSKETIELAGAADGIVSLNAPQYKASLGIDYRFPKLGIGYGMGWRWQDRFFASSAVYVGEVLPANFVDVNVSYRPNFSKNTLLTLDVQNILNYEHQRFPGTPLIGLMAMARISHTF